MCLSFDPLKSDKAVKAIRKKNKPFYAYKAMNGGPETYRGAYRDLYCYVDGLNLSSRIKVALNRNENKHSVINKGFHCFRKLRDAIDTEGIHLTYFRVKINPKDVVAVGEFAHVPSVVCTKFTVNLKHPIKAVTVRKINREIMKRYGG